MGISISEENSAPSQDEDHIFLQNVRTPTTRLQHRAVAQKKTSAFIIVKTSVLTLMWSNLIFYGLFAQNAYHQRIMLQLSVFLRGYLLLASFRWHSRASLKIVDRINFWL